MPQFPLRPPFFLLLFLFLVLPTRCSATRPAILRRSANAQPQQGPVPDPSRVADPSLLPVHLKKPDYRPLVGGEGPGGGPKAQVEEGGEGAEEEGAGGTSSTVMGMGGGGEEGEEEESTVTTPMPSTSEETTPMSTTTAAEGPIEVGFFTSADAEECIFD